MQRVRQSLPYWRNLGWNLEVVAVAPEQVNAPRDPFLSKILPPEVSVHRVKALSLKVGRLPGLGSLGLRSFAAIKAKVFSLLRDSGDGSGHCVFFSSTQFLIHAMIPALRRKYPRLALAMDYQDPWVNSYYSQNPSVPKPGGNLKFWGTQIIARFLEPRALRAVDGITTVSTAYRTSLCNRYSWFSSKPWIELPFGGALSDFESLRRVGPSQNFFNPDDGLKHWVYVGRGGRDMTFSVRAIFRAFALAKHREPTMEKIRFHFLGTNYAPPDKTEATILPIAIEEGVSDYVQEISVRIPYGVALRCLLDADALVLPGSDDPGYSASKLYPCILARKPLLAVFSEKSSVHQVMHLCRAGTVIGFSDETDLDKLSNRVCEDWMLSHHSEQTPDTDWNAFERYTDRTMTSRLSVFLEELRPNAPPTDWT